MKLRMNRISVQFSLGCSKKEKKSEKAVAIMDIPNVFSSFLIPRFAK